MYKEEEEQGFLHKVYAKSVCKLYINSDKSEILYANIMYFCMQSIHIEEKKSFVVIYSLCNEVYKICIISRKSENL